jgi:hypothetical protein
VVGEKEHDRLVQETVGAELSHDLADALVHERNVVVVASEITTDDGGVRIVGGDGYSIGIRLERLVFILPNNGLVRDPDVENGKKGLVRIGAGAPRGAV